MNEIAGSAKLICDYCQRWRVRRFRGVFRMGEAEGWDFTMFYPNLTYRCPSCGATEFSFLEPKPAEAEEMLERARAGE